MRSSIFNFDTESYECPVCGYTLRRGAILWHAYVEHGWTCVSDEMAELSSDKFLSLTDQEVAEILMRSL